MTNIDTQFYKKKRSSSFYISGAFLFVIIICTVILYIYTGKIEQKNNLLQAEISKKQESIQNIRKKENIQIYSNYQRNKAFLDQLASYSDIPSMILHLKKNFAKYGLEARGFDYSEGKVRTNISVKKNDTKQAYQKIVTFLTEYRLDENSRFVISPIAGFSGYEKINYSLELTIK